MKREHPRSTIAFELIAEPEISSLRFDFDNSQTDQAPRSGPAGAARRGGARAAARSPRIRSRALHSSQITRLTGSRGHRQRHGSSGAPPAPVPRFRFRFRFRSGSGSGDRSGRAVVRRPDGRRFVTRCTARGGAYSSSVSSRESRTRDAIPLTLGLCAAWQRHPAPDARAHVCVHVTQVRPVTNADIGASSMAPTATPENDGYGYARRIHAVVALASKYSPTLTSAIRHAIGSTVWS